MLVPPSSRIADCFCDLLDPRIARTRRHHLLDIVTLALCAVLAGAESWVEVEEWGTIKRDWLHTWLPLPIGIPSHDTFGRVFSRLDPAQLESGFLRWVQVLSSAANTTGGIVAVDGKTVRAARERHGNALHIVKAWASASRLVLGQAAVDAKSNEIIAIPALLGRLDLTEQVVTIDAMGCQTAIADQIVAQGGDYVLALKANHADLLTNVCDSFALAEAETRRSIRRTKKGHGRIEVCTCRTITDPATLAWLNPAGTWPKLRSVAEVVGGAPDRWGGDPTDSVLSLQPTRGCQDDRPSGAQSLGHRESGALGARCGVSGGSESRSDRAQRDQSGLDPETRLQTPAV